MGVICEKLVYRRGSFEVRADWALPDGKSLALIGPSGSGKSLFLGGLAGFEQCVSGTLYIGEKELTHALPQKRPVTLMFQDHNLFPHLTVFQNVALGIDPGLKLDQAGRHKVESALASVELDGFGQRFPSQLSGGQQSRVALARALIRKRKLLLLDEPFSALGPGLRREMLSLVGKIRQEQEATLIFVTHAPEEAKAADLVSVVDNGTVTTPMVADDIFADPPATLQEYL